MPLTIKHTFHSPKLDGPDPTIVRPSNWNDAHEVIGGGILPAGAIIDFVGVTLPVDMLECYGQSISAVAYPLLFNAMVKQFNTVTFTLGTPGIVNWALHGIPINGRVRFRTNGQLPYSGGVALTQNIDYFIVSAGYSPNTFQIATTIGGTALPLADGVPPISGSHTGIHAPFGVAADFSTFTIPDLRGRVTAGLDLMGGVGTGRLTGVAGGVNGSVIGAAGGGETVVLAAGEVPAHSHTIDPPSTIVTVTVDSGGAHTHTVTGTISNVADHTHPWTGSVSLSSTGAAGGHTHTLGGTTDGDDRDHVHGQTGRHYGGTYGGAGSHTHAVYDRGSYFEQVASINAPQSGSRTIVQPSWEGSGSGVAIVTDAGNSPHEHSVYVDIGGNTGGRNTGHLHGVASITVSTVAAHTHTVSGTVTGTINPNGAHNHTFSSGLADSSGAHVHTASGIVDIAPFASGSTGSSGGHNNVQPTLIVRKLIFVG